MECKLAVPNPHEAITARGARPAERADRGLVHTGRLRVFPREAITAHSARLAEPADGHRPGRM